MSSFLIRNGSLIRTSLVDLFHVSVIRELFEYFCVSGFIEIFYIADICCNLSPLHNTEIVVTMD